MEAMVTIGFISFCCMLIFFMLSNFLLNDGECSVQDGAYCIESDCIGRCLVVDLLQIRIMY